MADDMTRDEFTGALAAMGWPRTQLARFLACDEKSIRQMETGVRAIPPSVARWLRRAVSWLESHPPPSDWRVR
jgi:DNA-binding transcriptional regulator YdaS (Cro superfamily)